MLSNILTKAMHVWCINVKKLVLEFKLFVVFSQHVVFVVKFFVAWLIPDVPSEVKARIKRERYLVQEYLHNYEVEKLKMQLSQSYSLSTETASLLPLSPNKHKVLPEHV